MACLQWARTWNACSFPSVSSQNARQGCSRTCESTGTAHGVLVAQVGALKSCDELCRTTIAEQPPLAECL